MMATESVLLVSCSAHARTFKKRKEIWFVTVSMGMAEEVKYN